MKSLRSIAIGLAAAIAFALAVPMADAQVTGLGESYIPGVGIVFSSPIVIGGGGMKLRSVKQYSQSITPVATAAAVGTTSQSFTVTGLVATDQVFVNGPAPTSLCPMIGARVSAANTLVLEFTTLTAATCTPVSGTYTITAFH